VALAALLAMGATAISSPGAEADHDGEDTDSLTYEPHAGWHPPPRSPGRLAPTQGALIGTHSFDDHNMEPHEQGIYALEQALGRTMDIDNRYYGDFDDFVEDGGMSWMEMWDISNGRIPLVGWGCENSDKINSGSLDHIIRGTARIMKSFGHEFFMRYCWEMDGSRKQGEVKGYVKFNQSWQRMHRIFQEEGATNVIWVWTPNAAGFKDQRSFTHNEPPAPYFYPGDEYVDWIATDGYNWGVSNRSQGDRWRHAIEIFDEFMVFARQHPKPIMIGEYGAQEQPGDPEAKAEWLRVAQEVFTSIKPQSAECPWCGAYSDVAALVYFDVDYGKHGDWRIMSSPQSLDGYRISATDPYTNQINTINWAPAANRPASPPAGPQSKPEPPPHTSSDAPAPSSGPESAGKPPAPEPDEDEPLPDDGTVPAEDEADGAPAGDGSSSSGEPSSAPADPATDQAEEPEGDSDVKADPDKGSAESPGPDDKAVAKDADREKKPKS
jgi:hypothetical protein